ncbi:hypothetical protein CHU98_g8875 [Xylaria longipes]|nr:hypothetical protein CHU98_g8875 [Xylaria longipes]
MGSNVKNVVPIDAIDILLPSAEMPIMPMDVSRLVGRLDRGDTMTALYTDMMTHSMVDCIGDKEWFGEHASDMLDLFHSMSRPLLRSLLTKTLGPDLYSKDIFSVDNWKNVYDIDGPGAYAMFSYVRGRKGMWLCANEIREVVSLMTDYKEAVNVCIRRREDDVYGCSQLTDEEKRVLERAMEIDDAERTNKQNLTLDNLDRFSPRFESKSTGSGFIAQLIAMLERRCLPNRDPAVWQMQSPLMVGSAGNMKGRTIDHFPDNPLSNTPKTWGLLLSCMRVMEVEYEVQAVPLFRAWTDATQVNAAEVLGTVLAGSMVSVAGMNVKQPGAQYEDANPDPYRYLNSREHVFAAKTWLRENLEYSIRSSEHNQVMQKQLDDAVAELNQLEEEEGELLNEEKELQQELDDALETLEGAMAELERGAADDARFLAATEEKAKAAERFLAVYGKDVEDESVKDGSGEGEGEDDSAEDE